MTEKLQKEITVKVNLNTLITSISAALIVAGIIGVFSMKNSITDLQIKQVKMGDAIEELQRSVNRLNIKK